MKSPIRHSDTPNNAGFGKLDASSHIPLYHQLFSAIVEKIKSGQLRKGDLLPSENSLMDSLGVSRITVKRTLDELARGGFVTRKRGVGTRVVFDDAALPVFGCAEDVLRQLEVLGQNTTVEILERRKIEIPDSVATNFRVVSKTDVEMLVRRRSKNNIPFCYMVSYIPTILTEGMSDEDLASKSLLNFFSTSAVEPFLAEQTVSAMACNKEMAENLLLRENAPILHINRTIFRADGQPIQDVNLFYNPEIFKYRMKLSLITNRDSINRMQVSSHLRD